MKVKITRKLVIIGMILLIVAMIFVTGWLFSDTTTIFNDTINTRENSYKYGESEFGWIHICVNVLDVILLIAMVVSFLFEFGDKSDRPFRFLYGKSKGDKNNESNVDNTVNYFNWKNLLKYGLFIIFTIYCFKMCRNIYNDSVFMYNTSKLYHNNYNQKVQEKQGFYDKLWKTYLQKDKITNVNKETFITVTKIIMENRRDGQQVTWKWIQENQQIPYNEFTKFYSDLSIFITEQREGYFNIEKECQMIANRNNTLLDTFPNNIYNKVLELERINFEYGFLSDSTNNVFSNKKENL